MAGNQFVIVVGPSSTDTRIIEESLALDGVSVVPAFSVLEGLQRNPAAAPVVLYDADEGDKWMEALQQILEQHPRSRVVFLSRRADDRMWMDVLENGGYDLVIKPLRATELRAVVRSALASKMAAAA